MQALKCISGALLWIFEFRLSAGEQKVNVSKTHVHIQLQLCESNMFFIWLLTLPRAWGGGGTLILSYIRRLGSLKFNIFLGFQKNKYFWGIKILWIFFGGGGEGVHHKIGLFLGVFSFFS